MAFTLAAVLLVLLMGGLWVGISLFVTAFVMLEFFTTVPIMRVTGTAIWGSLANWTLVPLPLFILMGDILIRSKISSQLFSGLAPWLSRVPGGLLHINVIGSGIFAAISGSSAATAATIGRMSIPELRSRGYDDRMLLGSLAGSATLGFLIPPSIIMIIYGVNAQASIARLFIAGILPGLMILILFSSFIILHDLFSGKPAPRVDFGKTFIEKLKATTQLFPAIMLIVAVIGSIYSGLATPNEAAAVGVVGAVLLSVASGTFSLRTMRDSLSASLITTCMICLILAGSSVLTSAMAFTGLPRELTSFVATSGLSPGGLILTLTVFFVILGCFLDGISLIVLTTAIILPMIKQAGIDPLWFGVYLVIVVEMSQVTPPIGFNLFVLQAQSGRDILYIARAVIPFFLILCLSIVIIYNMPEIVTWLPSRMFAR